MIDWLVNRSVPGSARWDPSWARHLDAASRSSSLVLPLMLCVAYLTLWERKVIGWMQIRIGPNRVGPLGLLQPIADAVKLLLKEIIVPTDAEQGAVLPRPDHDDHAGAGGLGGGAVRARGGAGQHQRRAAAT